MTGLIVFAGRPGSGKSTVAEMYGDRIGAPVLSIDPVDRAMEAVGVTENRPGVTAYVVVEALAEDHLRRGRTRVEARHATDPWKPDWAAVASRVYEPWTAERTVLDSAFHGAADLVDRIAFRP